MDFVSGIDADTFRHALARFASGVTVVTAAHEGVVNGSTVSAFTSVSLRPPLVLVCLDDRSLTCKLILDSGVYGVNVLGEGQTDLARHCAGKADGKMEHVSWTAGSLGVPLLAEALVRLECRLTSSYPAGDHTIFVGEVVQAEVGVGDPLLHFEGRYRSIRSE